MEYWDTYFKDGSKSGLIVKKGEKLPPGHFHIIVETLVKHCDGTYLVMQRDYNKKEYPGLYEGSAGGSLISGETKVEGAIREVREETGLIINEVSPIYYFMSEEDGVISQGYIAIISGTKDITYLKGETINHKWLTLKELKAFILTAEYNKAHASRLKTYLDTLKD